MTRNNPRFINYDDSPNCYKVATTTTSRLGWKVEVEGKMFSIIRLNGSIYYDVMPLGHCVTSALRDGIVMQKGLDDDYEPCFDDICHRSIFPFNRNTANGVIKNDRRIALDYDKTRLIDWGCDTFNSFRAVGINSNFRGYEGARPQAVYGFNPIYDYDNEE